MKFNFGNLELAIPQDSFRSNSGENRIFKCDKKYNIYFKWRLPGENNGFLEKPPKKNH